MLGELGQLLLALRDNMALFTAGTLPELRPMAAEDRKPCRYHDVWFDPPSIEDIRVHGIAER